ncbi:MAG: hypothetical protein ACP5U2_15545, partial [Bryobacteraceae bacterium]
EMFPGTRRAVLYPPGRAATAHPDAVRADFERIARDLAPCDLVLADFPWDIPDERVRWLRSLTLELSSRLSVA